LRWLNKERKLVMSLSNVDPQSNGSNLLARHCNHLGHKEMQDIKNDYDEENLSYLGLNLKWAWKVTRLGVTNDKRQGSRDSLGFGQIQGFMAS
jgi:hypothetical protein